MFYVQESCQHFVEQLAGKEPTPGGGGASALVGAVGTALGTMVGSLTVGKKKYIEVEAEILALMERSKELQSELLTLVQRDAEVFAPLARAYSMPKETKQQQDEKARVMEEALQAACSVPLEIMERCCRGITLCGEFADKGSVMAISDAGAGASFCKAALQSASLNVYINTKAMKDREYADRANRQADEMLKQYENMADQILDRVLDAIK